jgi:hypothetical protein
VEHDEGEPTAEAHMGHGPTVLAGGIEGFSHS